MMNKEHKSCTVQHEIAVLRIKQIISLLYCAANKLRGTFDQCSPALQNTINSCLLHANVCLPIMEQIHTD